MGSSGGRGVIIHLFFFCCFGLLVKGEVRKWDKGRLGGLLERYPNFHKSQMELREKGEGGRFLVVQGKSGMGNRLAAIVSAFTLALRTDRALLILWKEDPAALSDLLLSRHPEINFTVPSSLLPHIAPHSTNPSISAPLAPPLLPSRRYQKNEFQTYLNVFSRSRSSSFLVFIRSDQFFVDVGACARGDEKEQKKIDQEKGFWWTDEPPLSSRSHSSSLFDHDNDPSSSLFPGPLTTYGLLFDFLFKNSPAVDYFVSLREGGRDGGGKEGEVWLGGPIRSGHVNQNFLKKVEQLCSSPLSSFISSSSPPSSSSPSIFSYITDFLRLTLFPSWAVSSTSLFEEKCSENLHLFITTDGERKSIRKKEKIIQNISLPGVSFIKPITAQEKQHLLKQQQKENKGSGGLSKNSRNTRDTTVELQIGLAENHLLSLCDDIFPYFHSTFALLAVARAAVQPNRPWSEEHLLIFQKNYVKAYGWSELIASCPKEGVVGVGEGGWGRMDGYEREGWVAPTDFTSRRMEKGRNHPPSEE